MHAEWPVNRSGLTNRVERRDEALRSRAAQEPLRTAETRSNKVAHQRPRTIGYTEEIHLVTIFGGGPVDVGYLCGITTGEKWPIRS
jgi:hypothetical protein